MAVTGGETARGPHPGASRSGPGSRVGSQWHCSCRGGGGNEHSGLAGSVELEDNVAGCASAATVSLGSAREDNTRTRGGGYPRMGN